MMPEQVWDEEDLPDTSHASVARELERKVILNTFGTAELQHRSSEGIFLNEVKPDSSARCPLFQFGWSAFRYQGTSVD